MARVIGDLTPQGVSKELPLDTSLTHIGAHPVAKYIDANKGSWVVFHATTETSHKSFGVGVFSTGPITIEINTEPKRK